MASSSIRDAHPELAAAFAVLDNFFSSVGPPNLERTNRVLARCCFLWHAAIPAEIINSGEKSGGRIENSIWLPAPEDSDWDYTPPRYISDWLDPIVAAGILTPNEPPSHNNTNQPPAIPGIPGTYYMPPTTQRALTLHLAPPLLTTAFHTVLLALRSLYPGRLPPPAPGPIDLTTPTPLTTPLRTLLAHHISHLTITYSNHISKLRPQPDTTTPSLLRPLQSLLNDLTAYYIHTGLYPPARAAGAAALRVSGHPYPPRDELSREEFVLNLDTLLLNAWAWAEISPGTETAGYMDGYLVFEGSVEEEEFLRGVGTAAGYWEQGVEMLEEDGVERGEAVGREEVLDAIQRGYGEGRRVGGFRVVEEGYGWGNSVGCEGGMRRGGGGKRKGKGEAGGKRKKKGDVKGKRKGDVGAKRKRDKGDAGEGRGEAELTSASAEGSSFIDLTGSSPGATPLDEAMDGDSSSGLPAGNREAENDILEDANSTFIAGDNTNGKEKTTECPMAEEVGESQQQWEPDAELDAEFLLLAGDEDEPSNNVVHHLQSQTSQREDQNSALDEDFELLWGNEDAAMPDIESQHQTGTLPESQSDNTDSSSENSDSDSDDEASNNKAGADDSSSDSESGSDSGEESTSDEESDSDEEMDEDHNSQDEGGNDVGGLEGPVDSHTSSGASDQERQDAALEEEFLLIEEEGNDENTKYDSDSEESEEE